jgi:hypothetical protein
VLNLSIPRFPAGTEVALVRQTILIDTEGGLILTALTESVQLRVYRKMTPEPPHINYINGPSSHDQDFFEFRMSRRKFAQVKLFDGMCMLCTHRMFAKAHVAQQNLFYGTPVPSGAAGISSGVLLEFDCRTVQFCTVAN